MGTNEYSERSLIFDSSSANGILELKNNYSDNIPPADVSDVSNSINNIIPLDASGSGNNYIHLPKEIQDILDGNKYVTYNSIKKYMKISKNESLPPSLKGHFHDFYKLMVINMIKLKDPSNVAKDEIDSLNTLFKINDDEKELAYKFRKADFIHKIVKRNLQWYLKNNIVKLLQRAVPDVSVNDALVDEIPYIFDDVDFAVSLNGNPEFYVDINGTDQTGKHLNYFRINEKLEKDDSFLIYSNDYTSIILERQFNTFYINQDILKLMNEYGADPFIKNNMNETAIAKSLLNYYYHIFNGLRNDSISYDYTKKIDINDNKPKPHKYIITEL